MLLERDIKTIAKYAERRIMCITSVQTQCRDPQHHINISLKK